MGLIPLLLDSMVTFPPMWVDCQMHQESLEFTHFSWLCYNQINSRCTRCSPRPAPVSSGPVSRITKRWAAATPTRGQVGFCSVKNDDWEMAWVFRGVLADILAEHRFSCSSDSKSQLKLRQLRGGLPGELVYFNCHLVALTPLDQVVVVSKSPKL